MSVNYVKGDLLQSKMRYICHQVNCQGRMGSGIAKSIRAKWPVVYDVYMRDLKIGKHIGDVGVVGVQGNLPTQYVLNLYAQENYGYDSRRYTSYDAFWNCLGEIRRIVPKGDTIGFPDHIGCGLGGANWEIILTMIKEALGEDYEIYIYRLEEQ